jgi:hypothetical protein
MFGKSLSDIRLKMGVTPRSLPKINFKIIHSKGKEHRHCFNINLLTYDWLIDRCLTPTLTIFELYRGAKIWNCKNEKWYHYEIITFFVRLRWLSVMFIVA